MQSDFLKRERLTARHLWELVAGQIEDSPDAYLIIDDMCKTNDSRSIEMVKLQYSGAEGGLVRGIGVVNLIHTSGEDGDYYPIDFRSQRSGWQVQERPFSRDAAASRWRQTDS